MKMNNKVYDILKWVAMVVLPAVAAFYCAIAAIWHLPYAEQVAGTITAIDALLGALLGISSNKYEGDGTLYVDKSGEKDIYRFDLGDNLGRISEKSKYVLKVDTTANLQANDTAKGYVSTTVE